MKFGLNAVKPICVIINRSTLSTVHLKLMNSSSANLFELEKTNLVLYTPLLNINYKQFISCRSFLLFLEMLEISAF